MLFYLFGWLTSPLWLPNTHAESTPHTTISCDGIHIHILCVFIIQQNGPSRIANWSIWNIQTFFLWNWCALLNAVQTHRTGRISFHSSNSFINMCLLYIQRPKIERDWTLQIHPLQSHLHTFNNSLILLMRSICLLHAHTHTHTRSFTPPRSIQFSKIHVRFCTTGISIHYHCPIEWARWTAFIPQLRNNFDNKFSTWAFQLNAAQTVREIKTHERISKLIISNGGKVAMAQRAATLENCSRH